MPRRNVYLLVAGFVALAACARPLSDAYTTQTTTGRPPVVAVGLPAADDQLIIGGAGFVVHNAGDPNQRFDGPWAAVLDTLNRYLDVAVLTPLRTGGPAGDLAPLFTPVAVGRVMSGPDRAAFIDEGLPPATDVRRQNGVATLVGLAGPDAALGVVSAQLDLRLTGLVDGAPLTVVRTGELILLLDGPTWRIDAWDLTVTRTLAGITTSTTAHA